MQEEQSDFGPAVRIALFTGSMDAGGAERVFATLAEHWASRGHDVTLLTGTPVDGWFYRVGCGVRRHSLGYDYGPRSWLSGCIEQFRRLLRLRRWGSKSGMDVLLANGSEVSIRSVIALLGLKVRVVACEHAVYGDASPWVRRLRRVCYPLADRVVLLTESDSKNYAFLGARTAVIPNPVKIASGRHGSPSLPRGNVILGVGSLTNRKGFDLLLQAFSQIATRFPGWKVHIVGTGPQREGLQAQAVDLGLSRRVVFRGLVRRVEEEYEKASIFVLSSRGEAFPMVLCEAMAHGLPVVSFDGSTGPSRIVTDGRDGRLVPQGDVEGLAQALADLMESEEARRRLGKNAARSMTRLTVEQVARHWEPILAGKDG